MGRGLRLPNTGSDHHLSKQGAAFGSPFCIEQGREWRPALVVSHGSGLVTLHKSLRSSVTRGLLTNPSAN